MNVRLDGQEYFAQGGMDLIRVVVQWMLWMMQNFPEV